jgi:hypothetical protein
MTPGSFYRGGNSLKPKLREVKIDPATGLVQTQRGVSVFNRPDNLDRFGGAFLLTKVPESLRVIQQGRDPAHHEIVPVSPMTMDDYEAALNNIVLGKV